MITLGVQDHFYHSESTFKIGSLCNSIVHQIWHRVICICINQSNQVDNYWHYALWQKIQPLHINGSTWIWCRCWKALDAKIGRAMMAQSEFILRLSFSFCRLFRCASIFWFQVASQLGSHTFQIFSKCNYQVIQVML